jgi:hypothetical protein
LKTWYSSGSTSPLTTVSPRPQGGVDHHDLWEAALGVEGEHHTGPAQVGAHHALHPDGQGHGELAEAHALAVVDRPVGEERGVATSAGVEQLLFAADVEERLLLSREAGVGQVLGGSAAAYRDLGLAPADAAAEFAVGRSEVAAQAVRQLRRQDGGADRRAHVLQGRSGMEPVDLFADDAVEPALLEVLAVGRRRGGEALGHAHPGGTQMPGQLPQ